jgi:dipeptidyl-peptidase-4
MQRLHPVLRGLAAAPHSALSSADAAPSRAQIALEMVEPRLRGIYEEREFGENPGRIPLVFRAEWLDDSSGYILPEDELGVSQGYDAASGESLAASALPAADGPPRKKLSDILQAGPGPVSNGQAAWSPDGARVAYVQSDSSQVRLRSMIIPGDPSYPEVEQTRFARVGGVIASLKVGVVDAIAGGDTTWLPIPAPDEGFYLGQVDWAGNSEELLVEKLSRFRDERCGAYTPSLVHRIAKEFKPCTAGFQRLYNT